MLKNNIPIHFDLIYSVQFCRQPKFVEELYKKVDLKKVPLHLTSNCQNYKRGN